MKYLYAYAIAFAIFLVVDLIWIGVIAKNLYNNRIGDILLDSPRWGVAAVFYLLYIGGLIYFAVAGAMATGSVAQAAANGALFGFFTYLTYNATNLAVMKGYDPLVTVIDTAWGTAMGAAVASGTVAILALLGRTGSG
ncbi:DUF2177 family protein [Aquibium sp. A9E412]|uniref:DUF2177 family protein n=1 Tax=Aquibium sp. A9E412 TaxID=2976767 RepID=UPI0025B15D99|nr:DUF2177 family protein [Aquibium sp. A9E412]MDN2568398.1 DUF2177 family protein [Aquibium sp. A9E412]